MKRPTDGNSKAAIKARRQLEESRDFRPLIRMSTTELVAEWRFTGKGETLMFGVLEELRKRKVFA